MALAAGDKLGPYEILALIGRGGMGEVYRARDTKLKRDVAIKVLPAIFAEDPERLARFEREAQVLASLNHPNIASIYGVEERALIMEFVEGESPKGPMPFEDAWKIAAQVAAGLEYAHERRVIHRDLKPGNLKVTPEGRVKILDFGLARALTGEARPASTGVDSPTLTMGATQAGVIMGTAAYMAPEQVKGKEVDRRADIWAFGVVLYELLTGERLFKGADASDTMARVLMEEPDLSKPPAKVQRLIKECLKKDPDERLRWVGDVARFLEEPSVAVAPGETVATRRRPAMLWALCGVLAGAVAAGLAVSMLLPRAGSPSPARLSVTLPPTAPLAVEGGGGPALAVSPNGEQIVYAARSGGTTRLYVRSLDQFEVKPIPGTDEAQTPFFSPDGANIGFTTGDKLKTVPLAGGVVVTLADVYQGGAGATWGPDGQIVFNSGTGEGLSRIAATGGKPEVVSRLNTAAGEASHLWPEALPGGEAILFTSSQGESLENANVEVLSLKTGQRRVLVEGGGNARYVPPGHLVFARSGVLLAAPFDTSKLAVMGPSVPVLEGALTLSTGGAAQFSVSGGGTLAYAPGGTLFAERSLVWVDQKGSAQPITATRRPYEDLSVSPDGRRIALTVEGPAWNVWILELARGTLSRLTLEQDNRDPLWTPDGKRVVYSSFREGRWGLYWKPADGSAPEERLLTSDTQPWASTWSPDGNILLYSMPGPGTGDDLWAVTAGGDRKPRVFLQTKFREYWAAFSPDGHWLAYVSDESGREEVYVQAYPGPGARVQVSTDGGQGPAWAADGRRLFFRSGEKLVAAPVDSKPTLGAGAPQVLFEGRYEHAGHDYAVSGDRFVFIKEAEQTQAQTEIRILQNWGAELKPVAPAGK